MRAYLSLGSNMGDRAANIREALRLLSLRCRVVRVSSIYETPAMYYTRQGDFYNAAAAVETGLTPAGLLREVQEVEKALKRRRLFRNSPRTIDIDIIFYGSRTVREPGLRIPHPRLAERPFVLVPLREIAPRARHPVSGLSVAAMLAALPGAASKAVKLPSSYGEALAALNSLPPSASFSTAPVRAALRKFGRPQDSFYAVHAAGTNGKGSVCAMIAAALERCGLSAGLYLSPHITGPRERISLAGRPIPEEDFFRLFSEIRSSGFKLSYFEYLTVIAFLWFRERGAMFGVVEAGLGGRLDATNVFRKSMAVITNVSLEHAGLLGGTLAGIASHKAGIIRPGATVVTAAEGPALDVIEARAAAARAKLVRSLPDERFEVRGAEVVYRASSRSRPLALKLQGSYQKANASLALKVLETLRKEGFRIPAECAAAGIASAKLEGRFEPLRKSGTSIIIDGAHNPAAARALFASLRAAGITGPVTLAAVMRDKEARGILAELGVGSSELVFCGVGSPRARKPVELAKMARAAGFKAGWRSTAGKAFAYALERARAVGRPLVVAGSLYLAAEIKMLLKGGGRPVFPGELPPGGQGSR